jgi:hypothetical protein
MLACFAGNTRERKRTSVNSPFPFRYYISRLDFSIFCKTNIWPFLFISYSPVFSPIQMAMALPRKMAVNRLFLSINSNLIIIINVS